MGKAKKNAMSIAAVLLGIVIPALDLVNYRAGTVAITILLLATATAAFLFAMKDSEYRTIYVLVGVGSAVSAIGSIVGLAFPACAEIAGLVSSCSSVFTCLVIVFGSRAHKKKRQD